MSYTPSLFGIPDEAVIDKKSLEGQEFRILAWNMQSPSLKRAHEQWFYLVSSKANIMVLTELKQNDALLFFIDMLKNNDFTYSYSSSSKQGGYITLIAVYKFSQSKISFTGIDYSSRVTATTVTNHLGSSLEIWGVYAPTCGGRFSTLEKDKEKAVFHNQLNDLLKTRIKKSESPILIIGDLNILEPFHTPANPFFEKWDKCYTSICNLGFTDIYRLAKPKGNDHSWVSSKTREGQRLDHAFISNNERQIITGCAYVHDVRKSQLSDHSLIKLKIKSKF